LSRATSQSGFTLIEVLVAVVVLGIGLTGMAGLQIVSIRGSQQAYERTQASFLAYDIMDRMRVNLAAARAGDYDTALDEDVSALDLCFGASANCTPAEFADHDRRTWRQSVNDHLPGGLASVATATVAGQVQATVSVQWISADSELVDGDIVPQQLDMVVSL